MNTRHVEAKVISRQGGTLSLLIRAGDTVIQANTAESIPCAFPVWTGTPVNVQIPLNGLLSSIHGPASDSSHQNPADGGLPNSIKFPVFTNQRESTVDEFDRHPRPSGQPSGLSSGVSREPIAAIGVIARGFMSDGKRVETHIVAPVWNDGTAVLVTLNWYDGETSESSPNPEWYLQSTEGMPLESALRRLQESTLLPRLLTDCTYGLSVSPWKLGESALEIAGEEIRHPVWQRQWQYTDKNDFHEALGRVCDLLLGLERVNQQAFAGQGA